MSQSAGAITGATASAMVIAQDLLLGLLDSGREGLEPLDSLILLAIMQANRAPRRRVAASESEPPPSAPQARPISITRLAASLGSPFETVRRRVARFVAAGACEILPSGVVVSNWVVRSDGYAARVRWNDRQLCRAYRRLAKLGALDPAPRIGSHGPWGGADFLVEESILAGDFVLRMMAFLAGRFGGVVRTLIVLEMLRYNTALLGDARGARDGSTSPLTPDALKRPATIAAVARGLRLQPETVRRHVRTMVAEGLCSRIRGGFIVTRASFALGGVAEVAPATVMNLNRLYRALGQMGAIAAWGDWDGEGERPDGL